MPSGDGRRFFHGVAEGDGATMLVDEAHIEVFGGWGGDGIVSFLRLAYVPKGGPNGGDGGDGGNVVLEAKAGVDTLLDMASRHHWRAKSGQSGRGKSMTGAAGEDLVIEVPVGTIVYDDESGELIADMVDAGSRLVVAQGGKGGYGNEHFKSALNQTPRECTLGEAGEERKLRLELKLIADVGLVGKPNAGKSTLLSRVSKARPKIADYPFTTLEPGLGIVELRGFRRMVVADIPGLIEGAHLGTGLGHDFLRHIERTRVLVHLLEIEPSDGSDPVENYRMICRELREHSAVLAGKKQFIAMTKMDMLADEEDRKTAVELIEAAIGVEVMGISAVSGMGVEALLERCWEAVQEAREEMPLTDTEEQAGA